MITVEQTGPLTLIEDLGRPGLAHLGVSPSGAADRSALRLGNRLVGNPEDAAGLEITLGGLAIRTDRLLWCAVTGPATDVRVEGLGSGPDRGVGSHCSLVLRPEERLQVRPPRSGLRNYLTVRGGLQTPLTLGSRSSDLLSGLGPEPVSPGDRLPVGEPTDELPATAEVAPPEPTDLLWVTAGPRRDWFTEASWRRLLSCCWLVTAESNRVGVRLSGPALERRVAAELPSEGVLAGAVQVPPSGQPLVFGPDHPLTGGYPVIAVLTERSRDIAGQLRGGDTIRLREKL